MNIEDVKQLTDKKLNIAIAKLLGYKAVKVGGQPKYSRILSPDDQLLGKTSVVEQLAWESAIPKYSSEVVHSREAQAKAMSKDFEAYIYNLGEVLRVHEEHFVQVDLGYTSGIQHVYIGAVAHMLQATPRQIAEASYITLQEVQHET
jgi:hypothetical protein